MNELARQSAALVEALGLGKAGDVRAVRPLTGGVSSEIALVTLADRQFCVKFALEQLKVAAEWHAPLRRNAAEYRWLDFAAQIAPNNIPQLLGHSEKLGGFAMEFVSGDDVTNWKATLLAEPPLAQDVRKVASLIGAIHEASTRADLKALGFANQEDFAALRIEPYLLSMKAQHPAIAAEIDAAAASLAASDFALVHGDVSPKNILFKAGEPILLDAECATIGDPVFDVAFCLNHFLLKGVKSPENAAAFLAAASDFFAEYRSAIVWETAADFEARLVRLLPLLFLARVDGKSPVEYLDEAQQSQVRERALAAITSPSVNLAALLASLSREIA